MANFKSISARELKTLLGQDRPLSVIDCLPAEHHAARHIPGSINHCVYEMVFLGKVAETMPDHAAPLVAYSASSRCGGARDAAEKLLEAGYEDVAVVEDGLEGWIRAGLPLEGTMAKEPASPDRLEPKGTRLGLDSQESRIEWIGRSRTGRRMGTVPLRTGELTFEGELLSGGTVRLDMRGLKNEDLEDPSLAALLVVHLSSRDFFLVEKYPEAVFVATHVLPRVDCSPGTANYEAEGDLTLRGRTCRLRLPLTVERLDDGRITLEAHFDLDRTLWGAAYGSGRFFEKLGMHLVHDLVSLQARLVSEHWA